MKATEFCKFFEFTLQKEHGYDEEYGEYNYVAYDDQGVFHPRYVTYVDELTDMFDSCLKDYIDDNLEEDGFKADEYCGSYYQQALDWVKGLDVNEVNQLIKNCYTDILEALVTGTLEDDAE